MVAAGGGEGVDPLADDLDVRDATAIRSVTAAAKPSRSTARRSRPGPGGRRPGHDHRAQPAHLGVDESDGIVLGVVRAEAVRADQLGEAVGVVRGRRLARTAHLRQAHLHSGLGELPGGLGAGEAAADDVDLVGHRRCDSPLSAGRKRMEATEAAAGGVEPSLRALLIPCCGTICRRRWTWRGRAPGSACWRSPRRCGLGAPDGRLLAAGARPGRDGRRAARDFARRRRRWPSPPAMASPSSSTAATGVRIPTRETGRSRP